MKGTSNSTQFGLVIAYVLPGFIALAGLAPLLPAIGRWLWPAGEVQAGLGAPVYAVLAATALGLILSCFRWLLVDRLHQWTGVTRPTWDDARLDRVLDGFDYVVQSHYRYHEFAGNTLLALLSSYALNRWLGTLPFLGPGTDLVMAVLAIVLFAASRDALAKYYARTGRLVGFAAAVAEKPELSAMFQATFNGNDHGTPSPSHPKPPEKPTQQGPTSPAKPQQSGGSEPKRS